MSLRSKLIRLAHANPELRGRLLPLLGKKAWTPPDAQWAVFGESAVQGCPLDESALPAYLRALREGNRALAEDVASLAHHLPLPAAGVGNRKEAALRALDACQKHVAKMHKAVQDLIADERALRNLERVAGLRAIQVADAAAAAFRAEEGTPKAAAKPQALSFEAWMKLVNAIVRKRTGLSATDLPDCPYKEWYEDGKGAEAAARSALRRAKDE